MSNTSRGFTATVGLVMLLLPPQADASFHVMQIQKVIAGVNGDTAAQAIQLRMRSGFQDRVSQARIIAWDAAGTNPIVIVDFDSNVPNRAAGSTILATTAAFDTQTLPSAQSDFLITQPIPQSYLAAGSLTFEADITGAIYWRISWGGDAYTG